MVRSTPFIRTTSDLKDNQFKLQMVPCLVGQTINIRKTNVESSMFNHQQAPVKRQLDPLQHTCK